VPGETAAATQPFPLKTRARQQQKMTPTTRGESTKPTANGAHDEISKQRTGPIHAGHRRRACSCPAMSGNDWGGFAYDAARGLLILPCNHLAAEVRLIPRAEFDARESRGVN